MTAAALVRRLLSGGLVGLALAAPASLHGQDARAAVLADSILVGDVVPVAVRVTTAPGETVSLPPLLPLDDPDLENVARVQERVETLSDGRTQLTGLYAVTAWRPGVTELPPLPITVVQDGEARTVQVPLPTLEVVSVLPTQADLLDPMPPKDVLGRSFAWWPLVLLLVTLLALVGLGIWWARRRRGEPSPVPVPAPAVPPMDLALAALRDARQAGHIERAEWKIFYTRVSLALREYLEAVDRQWGEDLTTSEVVARVRQMAGPEAAAGLATLLRSADQVKFARREPGPEEAVGDWTAAVAWVRSLHWPPPTESLEEAA